jgi:hypothetical protein
MDNLFLQTGISASASRNLNLPFGPPIPRMAKGPPVRLHAPGGSHPADSARILVILIIPALVGVI